LRNQKPGEIATHLSGARNDKQEGPRNGKEEGTHNDNAGRQCVTNYIMGTPICKMLCFAVYYIPSSFSLGCYKLLRILPDSYQVLGDPGSN
jgi:hypothetical protein